MQGLVATDFTIAGVAHWWGQWALAGLTLPAHRILSPSNNSASTIVAQILGGRTLHSQLSERTLASLSQSAPPDDLATVISSRQKTWFRTMRKKEILAEDCWKNTSGSECKEILSPLLGIYLKEQRSGR